MEANESVTVGDQWGPMHPVQLGTTTLTNLSSQRSTIEGVLAILERIETDEHIEFTKHFYEEGLRKFGDFWGYRDLLTVLYAAAKVLRPQSYLEIGVFRGRSVAVVASVAPECGVYGLDLWVEDYSGLDNPGPDFVRSQVQRVGHRGELMLVSGDSEQTLPRFLQDHPHLFFDLVTVDGDHGEEGARTDLQHVLPRLKLGGVLVFDDISHPCHPWLDRVWNEVVGMNPNFLSDRYKEVGHGIAFAIRRDTDFAVDAVTGNAVESAAALGVLLGEARAQRSALGAQLAAREEELASVKHVLQAREEELASVKYVLQAREEELASVKYVLQAREEELEAFRNSLPGRATVALNRLLRRVKRANAQSL